MDELSNFREKTLGEIFDVDFDIFLMFRFKISNCLIKIFAQFFFRTLPEFWLKKNRQQFIF